jgi:Ca2+-binding RTX toxin-like protein
MIPVVFSPSFTKMDYPQGYSKPAINVNSTYGLLMSATSSATSFPIDPGNSLATANNLGTLSGIRQFKEFVGSVDPIDYYKFSLTGTNDIKLILSGVQDDYLNVRICQDRNGNGLIDTGEVLFSAEANSSIEINESLGAGNYFLQVNGQGYSKPAINVNSTYGLMMSATSSATSFPTDPGNSLVTANDLGTLNGIQSFKEFVGSFDPIDYYKFSLTSTNDVKLTLSGVQDDYLNVRICQDRNGNGSIDTGEVLFSAEANSSTEIFESLGAGTYFVQINAQGYSKSAINVNSAYSLAVATNVNPPSIPIDPGNILSTAYNIGELLGIQQFHEFVGSSDIVDYYKFSLANASEVKLGLSAITDDYLNARICRDSNNNGVIDAGEVLFSREANTSVEFNAALSAGNYFVQIKAQGYSKSAINVNSAYDITLVNNTYPSLPNTVSLVATSADEDGSANIIYTFTRTGSAVSALTVAYSATGTAGVGTDYGLGSISNFNGTRGTITFAAGSNQATLVLDPKADGTIEPNETVALSLVAGSGYTIGTSTPVTATIRNDDQANRTGVMLSVRDAAVVEGRDRVAVITIDLDIASSQPISVSYTTSSVNGTAGVDYTPVSGILTIPANSRTATLEVPILNDALNEGDESFIVTFTNPINATLDPERSSSEVVISDTLRSSITRVLPTGVENLLLTGVNPASGTGNVGNNTITGNSAGNYLTGKGGNDILIGGAGSDVYVIDADTDFGSDTITEVIGGGSDTLDLRSTSRAVIVDLGSSLLQTLATGVQVTFVGGTIENTYGGAGNDALKGNTLGNNLMGNAGNDQLQGLGGADNFYYLGAALSGTNTVAAAFGRDTIADFTVGVDKFVLSKGAFQAISSAAGVPLVGFASVANDGLVAAQTAAIVYSQGTGNLFYNQNGSALGFGTGGNFAVLTNKPLNLTATDFMVIA